MKFFKNQIQRQILNNKLIEERENEIYVSINKSINDLIQW